MIFVQRIFLKTEQSFCHLTNRQNLKSFSISKSSDSVNLILNIGLQSHIIGGEIDRQFAVRAVREAAFGFDDAADLSFHRSDSEETLVVRCVWGVRHRLPAQIDKLCARLWQDCIAVYDTDRKEGQLLGPRAGAYGSFNSEFFILPDGQRLKPRLLRKQEEEINYAL